MLFWGFPWWDCKHAGGFVVKGAGADFSRGVGVGAGAVEGRRRHWGVSRRVGAARRRHWGGALGRSGPADLGNRSIGR